MEGMSRSELLKKYLSVTANLNLNSVKNPQTEIPPVRSEYPYGRGESVPSVSFNKPHYHSTFSRNSRVQSPPNGAEGISRVNGVKRGRRGEKGNNNNNDDNTNNNNSNNSNNNNDDNTNNNNSNNSNNNNRNNIDSNNDNDNNNDNNNTNNSRNDNKNNDCYYDNSQYYKIDEKSVYNSAQKWLSEWNKKTNDKGKDKEIIEKIEKLEKKGVKTVKIEKTDRTEYGVNDGFSRIDKETELKTKETVKFPTRIDSTKFRSAYFTNLDPLSDTDLNKRKDETDYLRALRVDKMISDLPAMCAGDLRRLMFVRLVQFRSVEFITFYLFIFVILFYFILFYFILLYFTLLFVQFFIYLLLL